MAIFKKIDPRITHYDHFVVHCTATKASQKNIDSRWVDKEHKKRGWSGCGYHAVITREGKLEMLDQGFPTRAIDQKGAHVGGCGPGWNKRCFGVSLAGGLNADGRPEDNFTRRQYRTLSRLIREFLASHETPDKVAILGHRDLIRLTGAAAKACPCFDVASFLVEYKIHDDEDADSAQNNSSPLLIPTSYIVQAGDSLWRISRTLGISLAIIKSLNELSSDTIQPGQELRIS